MDVDFLRYQFEDGYDGVISKTKFKIGVRHIQILYMFVCSIVVGSLRGTVGIGLLAMTDSSRENDGYIQIHDWDRRTQGTILSSFFFGHAMSLIPAELYLKKVGGKIVITAVLAVNGALCVAMPTIANEGGWIAVCNAHFLMGMTQACICPINQALLEKWLPPSEKTMFSSIIYFVTLLTTWLQATLLKCLGIHLGVILALPITALISEARLGWELIYYSQAMLTISMAIIWVLLTANSPAQHQAVGDKEKEFVAEALSSYKKKDQQIPWRSLLNSKQFWSIMFAHAASNAVFVFYLTEVSAYLKLLGGTLRKIGVTAMIPFIGIWFINRVSAPMVDYLSKVGLVSYLVNLTQFRRLINGIGAFGTVIGLTVLPHLMPNGGFFSMAVFVTTFSVIGFQYCGFIENLKDISDSYRGTLVTVSCAVSGSVGALVPLFTGLFISDNDMTNVRRWRTVFITLSSFYVLCNIIYTGFSSSERQNWDTGKRQEKFGYHNSLIDATTVLELEDLKQTKPEQRIYEDSAL